MSYLADLPDNLGVLSEKFIARSGDAEARRRLGSLFLSIAECVQRIGINVKQGLFSPSECAELKTYIQQIGGLLSEHFGPRDASSLMLYLTWADEAPGFYEINVENEVAAASQPGWIFTRSRRADQISKIAGTIRALGNLAQT